MSRKTRRKTMSKEDMLEVVRENYLLHLYVYELKRKLKKYEQEDHITD